MATADVYSVPDFDPADATFSSDEWDGDAAVASYPDPSDEGVPVSAFRKNFIFAPPADSDVAENKSAYKAPVRNSHQGAINTRALEAVIAAINGARGGFEGIDDATLKEGYNTVVALSVAAGEYDDADAAPSFKASASDTDGTGGTNDSGEVFEAGETVPFEAAGTTTDDGLTGTIWGAGTITPKVNGQPRTVRIPEDTIGPTFEALEQRVAAGEATIGFDHPDESSVAAETSVGEIGRMERVALSADGTEIALTDSELTNNKAAEAFEAGAFDDYDYSVVGKLALQSEDGQRVTDDDGALVLEAARIHRADVVKNGAYRNAAVGAMPTLAAHARTTASASPHEPATGFVATLRAGAADIGSTRNGSGSGDSFMSNDNSGSSNGDGPFDDDPETLEAAQTLLDDAADVVESKDEQIESLEAEKEALEPHADGFEEIAASHGFDTDAGEFEAQDVIDEHTEDLREEVAELEASLPNKDTTSEGIDDRAAELKGNSVAGLEAMAGDLSREALRSQERAAELGGAIAAGEQPGSGPGGLGGGNGGVSDEEADALAAGCLNAEDSLAVKASDASPAEYVRERYNVEPTEYTEENALFEAMQAEGGDA